VGIAFFPPAVCGSDILSSILDSMEHVRRLVGPSHVALGSDWDGTVRTPIDAAGVKHVTSGLLARGFSADDVRAAMGGNVFRMLRRVLR
jgi:membrane dipeptidase